MSWLPLTATSYPKVRRRRAATVSCPGGVADSQAEALAELPAAASAVSLWELRSGRDVWGTSVSQGLGGDSGRFTVCGKGHGGGAVAAGEQRAGSCPPSLLEDSTAGSIRANRTYHRHLS